jgi:NarL family two-component system response regulator LiaR
MDGIATTRLIRQELPDTQVVAITSLLEEGSVVEAVRAGAIGYVLKDANAQELCRVVKARPPGR